LAVHGRLPAPVRDPPGHLQAARRRPAGRPADGDRVRAELDAVHRPHLRRDRRAVPGRGRQRRRAPRRDPGAGLLARARHPLRAVRAAVPARPRLQQAPRRAPPHDRTALRSAPDRHRRAADDRGVVGVDERAADPHRRFRTGGVMDEKSTSTDTAPGAEKNPSAGERASRTEGAAGSWSSKPEVDGRGPTKAPSLGLRGTLLFLWRQLTSMQTALILLMLLAIAAVPGSLYPQRSVNPGLTDTFLEENGRWGEILDALGFFEVFSSPWFSALYLLLFVS